jgi:hypothetical protein
MTVFAAGEVARIEGATFRPGDAQVGTALRIRAVYKDANGVLEEVFSAPIAPVINVNDPPVGALLVSDTTPTETLAISAVNAFTDADGLTTAVFAYQWQQANATGVGGSAAGFNPIAGATAQAFTPTEAQVNHELRVVVSYLDGQGFAEQVLSAPTVVTGDVFSGGGGNDVWIGTEGQDVAAGNGGNDRFSGLGVMGSTVTVAMTCSPAGLATTRSTAVRATTSCTSPRATTS